MRYVGRRDRHLASEVVVGTRERSVDGLWEQQEGFPEADAG
jgi:hypothetical protein